MSKAPRYWAAVGSLLLVASLGSGQTAKDPALRVTEVVSGLNAPTAMAFIGADDILVLQKNDGQVRRAINGVLQPLPVLDVAVDQTSERGLLGIAVHPAFPSAPWVYLYYTESGTGADTSGSPAPLGNRLYRYRWDGNALVEPTLFLNLPGTPGPNHDGGVLTFGPDGKLYAVIGDLNHRGQLQNVPNGPAADDTSVIFRLNDDGSTPSDNPFFGLGGNLVRYYAYGMRNSFGLAFDPLTNKLWQTENGPAAYDEINLVEPGLNSGWVQIMGPEARSPQGVDSLFQLPGSHYADPKFSWLDTVAPTAIVFLSSTVLGEQYQNDVLVGDINLGHLYHFKPTPSRDGLHFETPGLAADLVADPEDDLQEVIFGTGFGGITDLKVGADGRLYILSFQGKIFAVSQAAILQGTATDAATGAALEGVSVRAWHADPASIARVNTSTDASGTYALGGLSPGRYWVFFTRSGYRLRVRHVALPPGQTTTLNVQLPPR
jgi:glucose/arabinose dehydrogenase